MPQSLAMAAFVFGAVLLLIAVLGGQFKIFGAEVSGSAGRIGRSFAAVIGAGLIVLGLFLTLRPDRGTSTISSFQANPSEIKEGETTQLTWTVQGASSVAIDQGVGTVSLSGSTTVSPKETTTYTLSASQGAKPVRASTKVRVISSTLEEKNSVGTLAGDKIENFRVENYAQDSMTAELSYHFNAEHGPVWIGGILLDENGKSISRGFAPTGANPTGNTFVRVSADPRKGRVGSKWVFFWLYESNKGEGFVSKLFPYEHYWN